MVLSVSGEGVTGDRHLARDGDSAAGHDITDGGEEWDLGFRLVRFR